MNKFLFLVVLVSCTSYVLKPDSVPQFKIFPYMVMSQENEVYLKFEVNASAPLIVNDAVIFAKKNQMMGIPIGKLSCLNKLTPQIKDQATGKIIFSLEVPPISCRDSSPIYLGFLSDTHSYYTNQRKLKSVLSTDWEYGNTNLLLHGGDVVNKGGKINEWENFFEGASGAISPRPIVATIGNHEYQGLDAVTGSPRVPWQFENYLRGISYPWSGFILSFPQCNILIFNSNVNRMSSIDRDAQWRFLEKELQAAYIAAKPTILLLHHAVFTSNIFKKRKLETQVLQASLVPLLEKYKVPLILSGDVHLYERSEKSGVSYLTAGAVAWHKMPSLWGNPHKKFSKSFSATYTWLKVTKQKIVMKTFLTNRSLVEEHVIDLKKHFDEVSPKLMANQPQTAP